MLWRVDVLPPSGPTRIYLIDGDLTRERIERVARSLLADPVTETAAIMPADQPPPIPAGRLVVTVFKRPGVMDPVEESAVKALADLGEKVRAVRTGLRYLDPSEKVGNEAVDEIVEGERKFSRIALGTPTEFRLVHISDLDPAGRELSLNDKEIAAIRSHFEKLGRAPTDVELETIAQTWSEHCKHKTFNAQIDFNGEKIDNLLKSTIMRATRELAKPWCVSVFKDNAGIIEFDDRHNLCFKVETHNHPSAIEPYGGANTGIGGVIRDIMGCGLGAWPIADTDVFCVGPPDMREEDVPPGAIHPRRVLTGVVEGVRDYGNRMGIPTVNGAVCFDERTVGNPLVFCGTVGILPKDKSFKSVHPGDAIVVVGGRTGRDGIHGATFSSAELHDKSDELSGGAVQIGNAIMEKRMLDTIMQARDRGLYRAITDCGAGGLSSAVGEMGEECGAEVDLENVPLKYEGLTYAEIWISEAQERMVLAVPPERLDELRTVFRAEDVEATVIGRFTDTKRLVLRYRGVEVGNLDMEFLHHGVPAYARAAVWAQPKETNPPIKDKPDFAEDLKKLLAAPNICSKEWIIRQYDHEVQGGSVVKPLVGVASDGPGDAAVIRPLLSSTRGVAIGCGMAPRYGDIDPYAMAACAIDEAVRNVVSVGGDPARTAILDNFSWGNPDDPEVLGALVRAAQACYDVAKAFGTPFISGKDSLNNEFRAGDRVIRIPHTLLISALSIVKDVHRCVTMDLKEAGDYVWLVGVTKQELGASEYARLIGLQGGVVPKVEPEMAIRVHHGVARCIAKRLARSCHDVSDGGLGVALAEMAFAGGYGLNVILRETAPVRAVTGEAALLFSESPSRYLIECRERDMYAVEKELGEGVPKAIIGQVTRSGRLEIIGRGAGRILNVPIDELKAAWQGTMRW
ncbi:MAG: phosphoribosylformylglycinamidine synthase subunit PurL [Planctomycetes bacterium]|nr:phosphoribosylformylglycinamidine synthase subunit PurL [Planctomycetota bacterium]